MDNEFAELEAELLRLSPRHPSLRLQTHLADELDAPFVNPVRATAATPESGRRRLAATKTERPYVTATSWTSWKWANWSVAAALVLLMAGLTVVTPRRLTVASAVPPPEIALQPVKAGRTMVGSELDGILQLADGSAVQRVRDFYVDTIEWRDRQGRARLRWEVPRESVRFVGLAAY